MLQPATPALPMLPPAAKSSTKFATTFGTRQQPPGAFGSGALLPSPPLRPSRIEPASVVSAALPFVVDGVDPEVAARLRDVDAEGERRSRVLDRQHARRAAEVVDLDLEEVAEVADAAEDAAEAGEHRDVLADHVGAVERARRARVVRGVEDQRLREEEDVGAGGEDLADPQVAVQLGVDDEAVRVLVDLAGAVLGRQDVVVVPAEHVRAEVRVHVAGDDERDRRRGVGRARRRAVAEVDVVAGAHVGERHGAVDRRVDRPEGAQDRDEIRRQRQVGPEVDAVEAAAQRAGRPGRAGGTGRPRPRPDRPGRRPGGCRRSGR